MNNIKKEIPILDNLRAIAAWSVCLFHFIYTVKGFINKDNFISKLAYFGQYGVELFFIISGLVIPWSLYHSNYQINSFFKFFIKRLARLEPPYIISVLLMLVIILIKRHSSIAYNIDEITVSQKQLLLHIGYLVPFFNGVKWLLSFNIIF
jgi:peptidoglycan/LPS O-acetylase OafA/YrhL